MLTSAAHHGADLDQWVRDALDGGYFNKGEASTAASRVLVQRGVQVPPMRP
ncbi:hypothetical protein [Streptomyces sp. NPDC050528]|uniref:hypothetical protein n=1 Tax=Streptomyces sp. NPDC050528 TaxID=3365623 RepID=UPI0037BD0F4B